MERVLKIHAAIVGGASWHIDCTVGVGAPHLCCSRFFDYCREVLNAAAMLAAEVVVYDHRHRHLCRRRYLKVQALVTS